SASVLVQRRARLRDATAACLAAAAVIAVTHVPSARADDIWDNSSGNALWSNAANWQDDGEPTSGDVVTFLAGFQRRLHAQFRNAPVEQLHLRAGRRREDGADQRAARGVHELFQDGRRHAGAQRPQYV